MSFEASSIISVANMYFKNDAKNSDTKYMKTYNIFRLGDIAFEGNRSKSYSFGRFVENDIGDGIVSHVFNVFRPIKKYDLYYWKYFINNETFMRNVLRKSTIKATMMNNLVTTDFLKQSIHVPIIEEQIKIGKIIKKIDDLLALQERKLGLYKQIKKYLLQKMFANEQEKVPQIRFKGFTDDWQKNKLGELAKIVRGASPRPISDSKWFEINSDIGWLRISDVTKQDGRITYLTQHLSKQGKSKTRVIDKGHLLLSIAASVGKPVINYIKTGVHDGFLIFLNSKFDIEFMFQWLENYQSQWKKYGQPGSQINLNADIVKNQTILLPSRKEQISFSNYIKKFDLYISLRKQHIEEIKKFKQYLLQNLFV